MSQVKGIFERHIDALRRNSLETKTDFLLLLNMALYGRKKQIPPYRFRLAELLDPIAGERDLIERYRVEYYEMIANAGLEKFKELQTIIESRKQGGKRTGEILSGKRQEKIAQILEAEAKLLSEGYKERGINKLIARQLNLDVEYVRKARKERNKTRKQSAAS